MWIFVLSIMLLVNAFLAYVNYQIENYKTAIFSASVCGFMAAAMLINILLK